ncbi:MAG: hypothetical protein JKX73_06995, partial [Flavobacteriales bacterium]|nr:hypothetical protein [Flavobacteriales bacterium]
MAIPGGPGQPEYTALASSGAENMVDLFTGDFSYNIPLFEMDGFPISIDYNAGVMMEQEASWVGLGWNIDLGSINRQLRGIPDDFDGSDIIIKSKNMKPNRTVGISFQPSPEFFGLTKKLKKISGKMGLYYNNYLGLGFEVGATVSVFNGTKSLDLAYNSQSGATYSFNLLKFKGSENLTLFKGGINSIQGLRHYGLNLVHSRRAPVSSYLGVPETADAISNFSSTFKFKSGLELTPAIFASATYEGYYSEQKLRNPIVEHPAYGYMYLGEYDDVGLADFAVIKDRPFERLQPYLPASELTFDNFSYSGPGIGGSFRLHRSDAGIVSEPSINSQSTGLNFGLETGLGTGAEFGANIGIHYSSSNSGRWNLGNSILDSYLKFQSSTISNPLFEPAYYSVNGELTPEPDLNNLVNNENASFLPLTSFGYFSQAKAVWKSTKGDKNITIPIKSLNRKSRNISVSYLSAREAQEVGLENNIRNYPIHFTHAKSASLPYYEINRIGGKRKAHHVSSYTIKGMDGTSHIYGIPVYNNIHKEVSFNVEDNAVTANKLVAYSDQDASIINKKGKDHFYSSTEIPAYATTHLLTAVTSNDYIDYSDNGPSPDDAGIYIKYNYSLAHSNFGWRTPSYTGTHYAAFEPQVLAKDNDNIGHYIYGSKEIWYPHSIETKNYIAIFKLTARKDGFGVKNEAGELEFSKPLMKLSSIELYTRYEFMKEGVNAKPIKTVYFEYDYSLCPNMSNNSGAVESIGGVNLNAGKGKLSLKGISVKRGSSNRNLLSPYKFQYSSVNPPYNRLAVDRWGNYKPPSISPDNIEYPYVSQNITQQDLNASAWNLTEIKLPSGGTIEVKYESDRYAHVQNQQAGRMFNIAGFGTDSDYNSSAKLTSKPGTKLHLYVKLDQNLNSDEAFFKSYLGSMRYLYFKSSIDITSSGDHEYVSGYAKFLGAGVCPNNSGYGWIKLENMKSGDFQNAGALKINPLTWFGLQFAKNRLPEKVYSMSNMDFSGDK